MTMLLRSSIIDPENMDLSQFLDDWTLARQMFQTRRLSGGGMVGWQEW